MTREELLTRLLLVHDPTEEIIYIAQSVDFTREAQDPSYNYVDLEAAWNAARVAANCSSRGLARDLVWIKTRDAVSDIVGTSVSKSAAWDAALLATAILVADVLDREHLDTALDAFLWWLD